MGNAEEFTNVLNDNIYNLSINKGKTEKGSVTFLCNKNSKGALGFYNTILFNLTN